jgi:hypothetical protein
MLQSGGKQEKEREKGVIIPVFNQIVSHEDVWWSGGIIPIILNLSNRRRVQDFAALASGTHCIGGWVGPHRRSECCDKEKKLSCFSVNKI